MLSCGREIVRGFGAVSTSSCEKGDKLDCIGCVGTNGVALVVYGGWSRTCKREGRQWAAWCVGSDREETLKQCCRFNFACSVFSCRVWKGFLYVMRDRKWERIERAFWRILWFPVCFLCIWKCSLRENGMRVSQGFLRDFYRVFGVSILVSMHDIYRSVGEIFWREKMLHGGWNTWILVTGGERGS